MIWFLLKFLARLLGAFVLVLISFLVGLIGDKDMLMDMFSNRDGSWTDIYRFVVYAESL